MTARKPTEEDLLEVVLGKKGAAATFAVAMRDYVRETHTRESLSWRLWSFAVRWTVYPDDPRLVEITPEMVWTVLRKSRLQIVQRYEEYGKPCPRWIRNPYTASAYKLHASLCAFFGWAVRTGRLDRSPMDGISLPPR